MGWKEEVAFLSWPGGGDPGENSSAKLSENTGIIVDFIKKITPWVHWLVVIKME